MGAGRSHARAFTRHPSEKGLKGEADRELSSCQRAGVEPTEAHRLTDVLQDKIDAAASHQLLRDLERSVQLGSQNATLLTQPDAGTRPQVTGLVRHRRMEAEVADQIGLPAAQFGRKRASASADPEGKFATPSSSRGCTSCSEPKTRDPT